MIDLRRFKKTQTYARLKELGYDPEEVAATLVAAHRAHVAAGHDVDVLSYGLGFMDALKAVGEGAKSVERPQG